MYGVVVTSVTNKVDSTVGLLKEQSPVVTRGVHNYRLEGAATGKGLEHDLKILWKTLGAGNSDFIANVVYHTCEKLRTSIGIDHNEHST